MQVSHVYANYISAKNLKKLKKTVLIINSKGSALEKLTDFELRDRFQSLKNKPLKDTQAEGFAIVREAAKRTLGLFHHEVQLLGGLILLESKIAEMRTGEGKTLTIVAPAAMRAISENISVHIVTANSYLAVRDADKMRPLFEFLGLTCGAIYEQQSIKDKQVAYSCDIVYGVGHEFGFDYLKDNLAVDSSMQVQSKLSCAIVDEVDSILIDEAKTPMIISGVGEDKSFFVKKVDSVVRGLTVGTHVHISLKDHDAYLTEDGFDHIERLIESSGLEVKNTDLYQIQNHHVLKQIQAAVKAHFLYKKDKDYCIEAGELVLVDTGTGRKMYGRRLEEGLHEALEAKEYLAIKTGSVTQGSVTYQNFFKKYKYLSGLSGTALTDADEFSEVYGLSVVEVPTHRPVVRKLAADRLYPSRRAKFEAVALTVQQKIPSGQPCLIGCGSVRDAEYLSSIFNLNGIKHNLLTAKHIAQEAEIIAQAGLPGTVTIATNMAGRGTDILLGGSDGSRREEVLKSGGLFVLVTERNFLRRVDNQFAGRCGRQGDPGEVAFFLSLEDDLLKSFMVNKKFQYLRDLVGNQAYLESPVVSRFVTMAQQKFESQGFQARSDLAKYDGVLANQRDSVFGLRQELLQNPSSVTGYVRECLKHEIPTWFESQVQDLGEESKWDLASLKAKFREDLGLNPPLLKWIGKDELSKEDLIPKLVEFALTEFDKAVTAANTLELRNLVLQIVDKAWTEHLTHLDELRSGAHLKAHNGLNPVFQFHKEAFSLFERFKQEIESQAMGYGLHFVLGNKDIGTKILSPTQLVRQAADLRWITRNEPCPCGSGLPYKKCHGQLH